MEETLEEAAVRELKEETGFEKIELRQLRAFSAIDRDPRGRNISVAFYGFATGDIIIKGQDDASDARWFPVSSIPALAFDHNEVLKTALNAIKFTDF
ncbi:MAG: NUDIX hydrolase [Bacteroidia bacterium]|nr:NUDIX hydrolase [Bacteroidia bacterium]